MAVDVLIVEDNPTDQTLILMAIEKYSKLVQVATARDGVDALDKLMTAGAPRLIMMDIRLPHMDGLKIVKRLRNHIVTRTIPIVIFTGAEDQVARAYEHGINAYVIKPSTYDEFSAVVGQLMDFWLRINHTP